MMHESMQRSMYWQSPIPTSFSHYNMHEFYDTLFHKRTRNFIMRYQLFFRKFYPPLGAYNYNYDTITET